MWAALRGQLILQLGCVASGGGRPGVSCQPHSRTRCWCSPTVTGSRLRPRSECHARRRCSRSGCCCARPLPFHECCLVVPIVWSVIAVGAALSIGITPDLLLLAGAASVAPLLLPVAVRPAARSMVDPRRGCGEADARRRVLGASRLRDDVRAHHGSASRRRLAVAGLQLGYRRGGLYSYDWLDRLFGYLDRPSATALLPEFQRLHQGDVIPLGHGPGFPVKTVEANRTLVLGRTRNRQQPGHGDRARTIGARSDPHHLAEQGRGAAHGGRTRVHCAAGTGRVPDDAAHAARAGTQATGRVAVPARGCAPAAPWHRRSCRSSGQRGRP